MRYLLAFMLNLSVVMAFSQGSFQIDPTTNRVSNFDATYQFTRSCVYDNDLRGFINNTNTMANSTVAIRIDKDGVGRLIIFVREKVVFLVDSCVKKRYAYQFYLINEKDTRVTASLLVNEDKVNSFWLDNPIENTSIVFFNK